METRFHSMRTTRVWDTGYTAGIGILDIKILKILKISGPRWISVQSLGQIGPAVLP